MTTRCFFACLFPADEAGLRCGEMSRGTLRRWLRDLFPADEAGLRCGEMSRGTLRRWLRDLFPADEAGLRWRLPRSSWNFGGGPMNVRLR